MDRHSRFSQRFLLIAFLISVIAESILSISILLVIPTDKNNLLIFGFSGARLLLLTLLVLIIVSSLASIYFFITSDKFRHFIEEKLDALLLSQRALWIITLAYLVYLSFFSYFVHQLSLSFYSTYSAYFIRLAPFILSLLLSLANLWLLLFPYLYFYFKSQIIAYRSKGKKEQAFILITIFLVSSFTFTIMEITLRLVRPQITDSVLRNTVGTQYANSDFIPFTLKANYEGILLSQEKRGEKVTVKVNSLGLRGEEVALEKPASTKRILVLGDSYTFGVYVGNDDTYPAVLQQLLQADGSNVEVLNAGYADGWEPDEHYAWLVNRGYQFEPDLIIYGFFIGNDIDQLAPEYWEALDERGLPTKVNDTRYFVNATGAIQSTRKTDYSAGTNFIYRLPVLRESHTIIFFSTIIEKRIMIGLEFFTQIGIIGNDEKVETVEKQNRNNVHFPFVYLEESTTEMNIQEAHFLDLVQGLNDEAAKMGADFLMVMIPINYQVIYWDEETKPKRDYYDEIEPVFDDMGISYINILNLMLENPGDYFPENLEVHNNEEGYSFIAEQIKNYLDAQNWP